MCLVSIIVPSYNHCDFLVDRLDSIISQTFKNFECILLDDASTDNSVEILEKYVNRDSRFKLFVNKVNSGSTFAQWNYGVSLSSGKYIWIAESDDFADSIFLQTIVDVLENNDNVAIAYSQSELIDKARNSLGLWNYQEPTFKNSFKMYGVDFILSYLLISNYIPNASAVLFRKSDFYLVGQSIEELTNNGDWNLWLKLLTRGDLFYISTPLNYFRQHDSSVTALAKTNLIFKNKFDRRITKLRSEFNSYLSLKTDEQLQKIRKKNTQIISYEWGNFGFHLISQKKYVAALYFILKASFYPNFKSYYLKKVAFGNFYYRLFSK
jgi:glycosyltransferase involved in cell wall biosynthesis